MVINISYLVSAILMPIAGHLIDKHGYLVYFLFACAFINLFGHSLNLVLPDCGPDDGDCTEAIVPYIFFGINYTVNTIVAYGAIPYVVDDPSKLGTAYGVFTCLSNLGNTVIAYLAAVIQENTQTVGFGYFWVEIFFIFMSILLLFTVVALYYIDKIYRNGILCSADPFAKFEEFNSKEYKDDERAR